MVLGDKVSDSDGPRRQARFTPRVAYNEQVDVLPSLDARAPARDDPWGKGADVLCEQMSSRERWDALIRGERPDRVPCLQFILGHTAVVSGKSIAKVYDDAAMSLACQQNAMRMYGYDGLILHGWANAGGAEFGGEIEFPYRKYTGAPMMKKNPVQNEDDAWNLKVPEDITAVGTIPVALEFSRLQYEAGMPVTVQVGSPLTWAGSVCGEERLMLWVIKRPDLVHHVLRVITEFILQKAAYWVKEFGPERVMAFDLCIETNKLYSPKQFETFAFPYLKEIHDRLTAVELGIFLGNVDPVTMQEGTPEEVLALCTDCLEEGKYHPGGYALMTGCEVPPQAPPVNVSQMVTACREYGRY